MIKHLERGDLIKSKENRKLYQIPPLPTNLTTISNFTSNVDNYLSDQFGYRDLFIKSANRLNYYLFNESTSKQITIGKNKFIYLNSHNAEHKNSLIKSVCGMRELSKLNKDLIVSSIKGFLDYFSQQGYVTTFAIIPTKSRIYPENLPKPQSTWCLNHSKTWMDNLIDSRLNNMVYYPLNKMRKWKNKFDVYVAKHFHWNGELSYKVAEDIMKNIWGFNLILTPSKSEAITKSDLSRFLLGVQLKDQSVKFDYSKLGVKECKGNKCISNLKDLYERGVAFHYEKQQHLNRRLLILSDSFGAEIAQHFIRGFDEVTNINITSLKDDEQQGFYRSILNNVKPTHFLFLIHDGNILGRSIKLKKLLLKIDSTH